MAVFRSQNFFTFCFKRGWSEWKFERGWSEWKLERGWSERNEWNEWSEWSESYVTFVTNVTYVTNATNVRNVKQEMAIGGDASRHFCVRISSLLRAHSVTSACASRHSCARTPSLLRAHLVTYRRAAVSNESAGKSLFLSSSLSLLVSLTLCPFDS